MPLPTFGPVDPFAGRPRPASLAGSLLVASPRLADPNFARRVVLVLDHGDEGALGVVLDRPGGVDVADVLPRWASVVTPPRQFFAGGPVARNAVIGLLRLRPPTPDGGVDDHPDGWRQVVPGAQPVGTIDLDGDPSAYAGAVVGARLFAGYAGWAGGQLEDEIDEGSWFVLPALERDPVSADPEGLWRRVLRREGGSPALAAGFPEDPTRN